MYNLLALSSTRKKPWLASLDLAQERSPRVFSSNNPVRIPVYGSEIAITGRGVGLWSTGYRGTMLAAGAEPVFLKPSTGRDSWDEILEDFPGVVACGHANSTPGKLGDIESLCLWCREHRFPLLVIDQGLLAMNAAFGGINYTDLSRELPEALQHRHPPEPGLRHAINVLPNTLMSRIFGEGEIVVNSEHRAAIQRVARGFVATCVALDGVIEAVEYTGNDWFAIGVQWQPASPSASGLDIQVFRALIDAAVLPAGTSRPVAKMALAG
jgi:putative glutamine amidotransferase